MGDALSLDPRTSYHERGLLSAFTYRGLPVVIRRGGTYPAVMFGGQSTSKSRHIDCAGYESVVTRQGISKVTSVTAVVTAVAGYGPDGRERSLEVARETVGTPEQARAFFKKHLAAAADLVPQVSAMYDAAYKRIFAVQRSTTGALSRSEYEQVCREQNVEIMGDAEIDSYAVQYGDYAYPEYAAEYVCQMDCARARLRGMEAEKPPRDAAPISDDGGFYRPDATPTDQRCARCRSPHAMWIAGAGEALCASHQDDY